MRISVINKKGGVGKTSLAYSIAKDLGLFLISNDDSVIELAYPNMSKIMKEPKLIKDVVYDFGGFVDTGVLEIINKSDIVIIPLTSDLNSVKKTASLIKELDTKKIILVANRAEKTDFEEIEKYFKSHYKFPIFEIKNSRIWKKTFEEKMSVTEIKNESKMKQYIYRNSITGYEELIKKIKGTESGK
jgi:cellulose biosynthesis protein BcsQ